MNATTKHYKYFLFALLIAVSCKKEDDSRHSDIVTATINGKPWKAGCKESPPFGCHIADLQYYTNTGGLELGAGNIEGDTSVGMRLWEVYDTGNYRIPNKRMCAIIVKDEPCGRQRHHIDENDPQDVEIINIDKENKIIEAKFSFVGRDTNCLSEPVYVTNGYFKLKYRP